MENRDVKHVGSLYCQLITPRFKRKEFDKMIEVRASEFAKARESRIMLSSEGVISRKVSWTGVGR